MYFVNAPHLIKTCFQFTFTERADCAKHAFSVLSSCGFTLTVLQPRETQLLSVRSSASLTGVVSSEAAAVVHVHEVKYLHLNNTKSQGLLLGLLFGSCTSMLLEQMPRALQQAHGVGEHNTKCKHHPQSLLSLEQTAAAWESACS